MSMFGHSFGENSKVSHWLTRSAVPALLMTVSLVFPISAQAQTEVQEPAALQQTEGLALNVAPTTDLDLESPDFVGLSSSLNGATIDVPMERVGSRLFNLDVTKSGCLSGEEGCIRREDRLDFGYEKSIKTKIDKGLDIELTPRAAVHFDNGAKSAVVGALVRIGDDLNKDPDLKSNTWYMFAGADAEAVTYSQNNVNRLTNGEFHLQDRIIVGDAQAGVGYRMGDADVSLGYFRREVTSFGREVDSDNLTFTEDAAALSFTWRR